MASKTWEIVQVSDLDKERLVQLLDDGWEPYAVVFIVGAGMFHYLRIYR